MVLAGGSEALRTDFNNAQPLLPNWKVLAIFEQGDRLVSFLSDADLPQKSGLDVLAWMRKLRRDSVVDGDLIAQNELDDLLVLARETGQNVVSPRDGRQDEIILERDAARHIAR